jgi:hypothetical protein
MIIKARMVRLAGHVGRTGRKCIRYLGLKLEGKRPLGGFVCEREDEFRKKRNAGRRLHQARQLKVFKRRQADRKSLREAREFTQTAETL